MPQKKKSFLAKLKRDQGLDARRGVLEEIFNDYYNDRRNIYLTNFIRGIFFGIGSAIGGTVAVAIILFALSFFVNIPFIGDKVQQVQGQIETTQKN